MATAYEWAITKDFSGDDTIVGTVGPRGAVRSAREIAEHKDAKRFRLVDDDGEIYCEGKIVENEPDKCSGFEPLDDYGTPALGATEIHYFENGRWAQL